MQSDEAQDSWKQQYDASVATCSHAYWRGNCRNVNLGHDCEVGLRRRTYNVVSGSVLSVWSRVEGVLASKNGTHNNKMQVIRLRTDDGLKVVGTTVFLFSFKHTNCFRQSHLTLNSTLYQKCIVFIQFHY